MISTAFSRDAACVRRPPISSMPVASYSCGGVAGAETQLETATPERRSRVDASHASCTGLRMSLLSTSVPRRIVVGAGSDRRQRGQRRPAGPDVIGGQHDVETELLELARPPRPDLPSIRAESWWPMRSGSRRKRHV
jgi:hypothetical protein